MRTRISWSRGSSSWTVCTSQRPGTSRSSAALVSMISSCPRPGVSTLRDILRRWVVPFSPGEIKLRSVQLGGGKQVRVVREPPLPPGWRLRMDRSTRIAAGGQVVFGGSPLRVLRLSRAGAELVSRWRAGAAVGDGLDERRLARRLLDAGIAHPEPPAAGDPSHPDPPAAGDPARLTVVVPVRDRPAELARCLAAI